MNIILQRVLLVLIIVFIFVVIVVANSLIKISNFEKDEIGSKSTIEQGISTSELKEMGIIYNCFLSDNGTERCNLLNPCGN